MLEENPKPAILCIDDVEQVLNTLRRILEGVFDVRILKVDSETTIAAVRKAIVDLPPKSLMLTDWRMTARVKGAEVVSIAHELGHKAAVMSGTVGADANDIGKAGPDLIITKPWNKIDDLRKQLLNLLDA